jgi:ABC-type branched-subunit amino acid transport system substrate-binding protein
MNICRSSGFLAVIVAAALVAASNGAWSAEKKYGPGVTDTEIKIGQTIAYSGPASSFGTVGHTISAYYRMINDRGGINGRKINFISADDGYSPPKTVEQTRRLVERDQVLAIVGSLGSPTNASVQRYLNDRKVPQLFLFTGTARFRDP